MSSDLRYPVELFFREQKLVGHGDLSSLNRHDMLNDRISVSVDEAETSPERDDNKLKKMLIFFQHKAHSLASHVSALTFIPYMNASEYDRLKLVGGRGKQDAIKNQHNIVKCRQWIREFV